MRGCHQVPPEFLPRITLLTFQKSNVFQTQPREGYTLVDPSRVWDGKFARLLSRSAVLAPRFALHAAACDNEWTARVLLRAETGATPIKASTDCFAMLSTGFHCFHWLPLLSTNRAGGPGDRPQRQSQIVGTKSSRGVCGTTFLDVQLHRIGRAKALMHFAIHTLVFSKCRCHVASKPFFY